MFNKIGLIATPGVEALKTTLTELLGYLHTHKLHINLDKSCYMYFSPTKKKTEQEEPEPNVYIGKTKISRVKSTKFLGIILDEEFNFIPHIKQLAKKLASCTGSINRIM